MLECVPLWNQDHHQNDTKQSPRVSLFLFTPFLLSPPRLLACVCSRISSLAQCIVNGLICRVLLRRICRGFSTCVPLAPPFLCWVLLRCTCMPSACTSVHPLLGIWFFMSFSFYEHSCPGLRMVYIWIFLSKYMEENSYNNFLKRLQTGFQNDCTVSQFHLLPACVLGLVIIPNT